jgi:hypothetical protein
VSCVISACAYHSDIVQGDEYHEDAVTVTNLRAIDIPEIINIDTLCNAKVNSMKAAEKKYARHKRKPLAHPEASEIRAEGVTYIRGRDLD